jgi:hypothetical protein
MTRTLPWLKRPGTATPQATHAPRNVAPRAKRRRVAEPNSDVDDEIEGASRSGRVPNVRGMSLDSGRPDVLLAERLPYIASPPPAVEPPLERYATMTVPM